MAENNLLSTRQVAERLRVSARTVSRMAEDGRLEVALRVPGYGGTRLFSPEAVDALAAALAEELRQRIPDEAA